MNWLAEFDAARTREIIAEFLFICAIGIVFFVFFYLQREIRLVGWKRLWEYPGNRLAAGLGLVMIGHSMIRGWTTWTYWLQHHGYAVQWIEDKFYLALIGLLISLWGKACLIRVLAPKQWKNVGWILMFCIALIYVSYIQIGSL